MINKIGANDTKQLNPFEIKAELLSLMLKLEGVTDFESYEIHYRTLDLQNDKKIIVKLLFKEVNNLKNDGHLIKFLLKRYSEKQELIDHLWNILKSNMTSNQAKIFVLDLLRDMDTNWSYNDCDTYLDNPNDLVDEDTKKLLNTAILNPEVQIDFLDFLNSLPYEDKIILIKSLGNDYSGDELANILAPVFLSQPDSEVGKTALDLLGNSKSQLAFHALNTSLDFISENIRPSVRRNLSMLKLAGIRQDNSIKFYQEILKDSKPYRMCVTYPDGHGNQAIILSRINKEGKIRFVAIVIDDYIGIKDCFGFNEISKFECNTIIDKFYKGEKVIEISPEAVKSILIYAENISHKANNWLIPYEYVCWKSLLIDVEPETYDIKNVLSENFKVNKLEITEFEKIINSDFMQHWFLNSDYSDEFEDFLKKLVSTSTKNFDKLIDENVYNIFYKQEEAIWSERLLTVAYLNILTKNKSEAQILYNLYNDENLKKEFWKNIIRRSIYEHYVTLKFKNAEPVDNIISEIESLWVSNV